MLITRLKRPDITEFLQKSIENGDLEVESTTVGEIKQLSHSGSMIMYEYPREILDAIKTWDNNMKCKQYYHVRDGWGCQYVFIEAIEI